MDLIEISGLNGSQKTLIAVTLILCMFLFLSVAYGRNASVSFEMDNNTRIAIEEASEAIGALEFPEVRKYNVSDCELIVDRQEFWCFP